MQRERGVLWASLVVSAVALAWMGRAFVTGQIPFTGDLLHWNYPIRDFYSDAIAKGQHAWWMPTLFGGFDVAGEGQLGVSHPLHWLLYRSLPLDRAFVLELVTPYAVAFAGMWLFLKRSCGEALAACGAMLFTLSGFLLSHGVHMNMVGVVAHVPWLLWLCDLLFAHNARRALTSAIIALVVGSQVLLGHPQALFWSCLLVSSYALVLTWTSGRSQLSAVLWLTAAFVLGAGMGSGQLLSTWYEAQRSTRPVDDLAFATSFSLPPSQLLQLIAPYLFWGRVLRWNEAAAANDEFAVYAGAVTLTLAVWWLASGRSGDTRTARIDRVAWWGFAVAVIGAWLATGSYGRLYYLQTWLPIVGEFRAPVRYMLFVHLGTALMAVAALARLTMPVQARRGTWAAWTLALLSVLVAAAARNRQAASEAATMASVVVGPALFLAAAALVTRASRGARAALVGLVLLAGVDQALYGLAGVIGWQDFVTRAEAVALLDEHPANIPPGDGRVARGGFPDLHVLGGYRLIDGYAGLTPTKALDYRSPSALRVAEVKYAHVNFFEGREVPGAQRLSKGWLKLPDPLPRARLVTDARVSRDPRVDIENIDIDRTVLVSRLLDLSLGALGTAAITRDDPGDIAVTTTSGGTALMVISESFDDGWVARVDGQPARVEQVNGDFMGVVVPAGSHTVALAFRPPYYDVGRTIGYASLVVTLLIALFSLRRFRTGISRPPARPADPLQT